MENKYYLNYFNSISEGLIKSVYYLNVNQVEPTYFFESIKTIFSKLHDNRGKIFFLGNGASAAFANHMALDFSKNGKILAKSLSDSALLTALANDYSFEEAMVEFLKIENISNQDLVITISSSGNSPNIVNALKFCADKNVDSLALSGLASNNKSIKFAKYSIYVPMKTYGMVECIHQIFLHLLLDQYMGITEWNRADYQNMNASSFSL